MGQFIEVNGLLNLILLAEMMGALRQSVNETVMAELTTPILLPAGILGIQADLTGKITLPTTFDDHCSALMTITTEYTTGYMCLHHCVDGNPVGVITAVTDDAA